VLLLHGLFGMGSNLGAMARALSDTFAVHQLDLPNHGRSQWMAQMDLPRLAGAIAAYMDEAALASAHVIGHSLGGKVAMQLAMDRPERVERLLVADIAPVAYEASHGAVFQALAAVRSAQPQSRSEAADLLRDSIEEEAVVQFLLLSLKRDPSGCYVWRFNAEGLERDYARILEAPQGAGFDGPVLLIHGADSNYVRTDGEAAARALFPKLHLVTIEGTGHWLHVEKPTEFNAAVRSFLTADSGELAEAASW
jgi:esterase